MVSGSIHKATAGLKSTSYFNFSTLYS